ncbi:MAG TPA: hypothetical protein VLN57_21370 [Xanthobacteraceae bacterium]|nr:hypothetical protein [Xanthobacteraceae bacterium]
MSVPSLWIPLYAHALTEPRIKRIARRTGLSVYDVLGRCCHLWMLAMARGTEIVQRVDVDIETGEIPGFVDTLVQEGMADLVDQAHLRIRGAQEVIDRLSHITKVRRLGGLASGQKRRDIQAALQNRTSVQQVLNIDREGSDQISGSPIGDPRQTSGLTNLDPENSGLDSINGSTRVQNWHPAGSCAVEPETRPTARQTAKQRRGWALTDLDPRAVAAARTLQRLLIERVPEGQRTFSSQEQRDTEVIRWAQDLEKLNRIGKIKYDDIDFMVGWCQKDSFWRHNIRSGAKLREKWDELWGRYMQSQENFNARNNRGASPTENAQRTLAELERQNGASNGYRK